MSGPEQIWAHPTERNPVNKVWQRGKWKDHDSGASGDTEYIRADAVAEMIRRAVLALEESNLQIVYLHERLGKTTGSGISVMARNEATIAALKESKA